MKKHIMDHENGISYTRHGNYYFPDLTAPHSSDYNIGIWGRRRLNHLKKHQRVLYVNLLTSGKLDEHLQEIDAAAHERCEIITRQMAETQGVTEQLKAENQMLWVGRMNNIRACAREIVLKELIYR